MKRNGRASSTLAMALFLLMSADVLYGLTVKLQRQSFLVLHSTRKKQQQASVDYQSETTDDDSSARAALERTAAQLQRLQRKPPQLQPDDPQDPLGVERQQLYDDYIQQPANTLKSLLKERRLSDKGRKPDLASRLVAHDLRARYGDDDDAKFGDSESSAGYLYEQDKQGDYSIAANEPAVNAVAASHSMPRTFAGLALSEAAQNALGRAGFARPTQIQQAAIPALTKGESLIIHAQTGSGKTIAYLLPITEFLWKTYNQRVSDKKQQQQQQRCIVLLPTRELAAQVAGVAMELAPPGSVRLVMHPSNLIRPTSQQQQDGVEQTSPPRLLIASAKTFMISLYGNDDMPAPPTSKPEAVDFLRSIRVCVLDEVDRLLGVGGASSGGGTKYKPLNKQHEKPAAIVAAAVARHTLGRAQIVAASATVGRPLKRELSRVLGLLPQDCPRIVRSGDDVGFDEDENDELVKVAAVAPATGHVGRAVTMPDTVKHYSVVAAGSSDGDLLTCASKVIRSIQNAKPCRMLLVLSKPFGISSTNTIGALKHFQCDPMPVSLLDALEAENTLEMIEKHRAVSQAAGVGQASSSIVAKDSYLLVTGEDTVRGLHLDGLDVVIVVGRPKGPDEYCHIAGRTGRAGRSGSVLNIVSEQNAAALSSWETMLHCKFVNFEAKEAGRVLGKL